MSQGVPVASNLLDSKMFGLPLRKLAESLGPPLAVPMLLYTFGFPLLITIPLAVVGLLVGAVIFRRTPPGQSALLYAFAVVRHYRGQTYYIWKPPAAAPTDLVVAEPYEAWITGRPTSVRQSVDLPQASEESFDEGELAELAAEAEALEGTVR